MTQAIPIPAAPAIIPAATYLRPEVLATYRSMETVPRRLQAMETVMVFIAANGSVFHLRGPGAGDEGVRLGENLQGEHHLFFEQVVTEGAYQFGATIERTNYLARKINLRVVIGGFMNNITYRACEERWWEGQDERLGGWLGVFTRFSGWRWIQVWPEKTVSTTQQRDPVAVGNNVATWDIDWIAPVPYYSKPAVYTKPWKAADAGDPDTDGFYHGTLAIPNRGDIGSYVEYLISNGEGSCWVQDNYSDRLVELPPIYNSDGQVLVDTDPTRKTLIAEHDPQDNDLFKILRASGLLNFFLTKTDASPGNALWLRGYCRFLYPVPPQSVVHLKVKHKNPQAQITAKLSQRFKRSR
jgi:hypothetical protein